MGRKPPKLDLSPEGIQNFIDFARQYPVSKLSVGSPGSRLTIYQNPSAPPPEQAAPSAPEYKPESYEKIKSDQVGTYLPVKGIQAGSKVLRGQVIAKVAAMKIESDITAPKDCAIKEVLAKPNALIEYGQPLFFIE